MELLDGPDLDYRTLADQITDRIAAAIVSGRLPPGKRILESTLAREMKVSRGPLREALHRLEGWRLVVRSPNLGARVVSLSLKDIVDVMYVREAMEGMAARLAAQNMTDEEFADLEETLRTHADHQDVRDGNGYFQERGDVDFHYKVAHGTRNPTLIGLLCRDLYYLLRIYRYRSSLSPGRAGRALDEHHAILDAMRKRDGDLAEKRMREHIATSRENLIRREGQGEDISQSKNGNGVPSRAETKHLKSIRQRSGTMGGLGKPGVRSRARSNSRQS